MAYPDIPHFDAPFLITQKGAAVVDQNTPEEILACARNIVVCPIGFRVESPEFGAPQLQFGDVPLQNSGLQQAIQQWEPRADAEIEEEVLSNEQERRLTVNVETANTEEAG